MYETGSASGVVDLITKLEAFLASNGWTTDSFATEGSGKRLHAHLGSVYVNMRAYVAETPSTDILRPGGVVGACTSLAMNIGTATGATDWFAQTGVPQTSTPKYLTAGINGVTGAIPNYHFFAHNSGANILAVIEYASGYFQFLGFGTLSKYGAYTGGTYFFGSRSGVSDQIATFRVPGVGFFSQYDPSSDVSVEHTPSFVSLTVDAETGWHWSDSYPLGRDATMRYIRDNQARFQTTVGIQPNSLNDLAVMMPTVVYVERNTARGSSSTLSPIGELPHVHRIVVTHLTPGQQITLGSDDYRVFPFFHKNVAEALPSITSGGHSSTWGFAVRET